MSHAGKVLIGCFAALGVPVAVVNAWPDLVVEHPQAYLLLLLYGAVVSFVIGVLTHLLDKRSTQVSTSLDNMLGRWFSSYGRRYRERVSTTLRFVNQKGLSITGPHPPRLSDIFVDAELTPRPPDDLTPDEPVMPMTEATTRHSIHDFLDRPERVVLAVIGAPGSGKSTLLRHLARQVAHSGRARRRGVPILLTLRHHVEQLANGAKVSLPNVLRDGLPDLGVPEPNGWWDKQLRSGSCVVLLDGLDEVLEEQHSSVVAWIERQIVSYPDNDWVITSRPQRYRTMVIGSARVLQLRPFTGAQARQFLDRWHLATERVSGSRQGPEVERRARKRAAELWQRLTETPGLHEMAASPLLLTMIANVHRHGGALPGSRDRLYREICQVMLERRRKVNGIHGNSATFPGFRGERVLGHVACRMMLGRRRDLSQDQVLEAAVSGLKERDPGVTAEDFLDSVISTGLLVERGEDLYAFAHHTIGEHLAAEHIRVNDLGQVLAQVVDDVWWRETTLFYVADGDAKLIYVADGGANPIVRAALKANTRNALALAFECDQSDCELVPELRRQLERIRAEAFAPRARRKRRRLLAGVLVTRHLHGQMFTDGGGLVCPRPITRDLYWLFRKDTGAPWPDGVAFGPDADQAVTGVWQRDAWEFVEWVNSLTTSAGDLACRLPTDAEVRSLQVREGADRLDRPDRPDRADRGEHGVWVLSENESAGLDLWTPDAAEDARVVTRQHVVDAIAQTAGSPAFMRLVLKLALVHACFRVRALAVDMDVDLAGDAAVDPAVDSARDVATASVEDLAHEIVRELADLDPDLARDAESIRDLLNGGVALPRTLDPVRALVQDLALVRDLTPLARVDHHLDPALYDDLVAALGVDHASETYVEGLPNRGTTGVALAAAISAIQRQSGASQEPASLADLFAAGLVGAAGAHDGYRVTVRLDRLTEVTRDACASLAANEPSTSWAATVAQRLAARAEPVFARRKPLSSHDGAAIRLPALALAREAADRGLVVVAGDFRAIASGVTLLQRRAAGEAPLETIILARA